MIDLIKKNPEYLKMAIDAIEFAKNRFTIGDYIRFCKSKPRTLHDSYDQRRIIMDLLINSRLIQIDGRQLYITNLKPDGWLEEELSLGDETTWKIVETINPNNNFLNKFDENKIKEIGLDGELFVIEKIKEKISKEFHENIKHVSLRDDSAGYDIIAPSINHKYDKVFLEVKTSIRPSEKFNFFISRNEYEVGIQKSNWFLIFVQVLSGGKQILGHLKPAYFHEFIPLEQDKSVKWQSLKISVDKENINQGLP